MTYSVRELYCIGHNHHIKGAQRSFRRLRIPKDGKRYQALKESGIKLYEIGNAVVAYLNREETRRLCKEYRIGRKLITVVNPNDVRDFGGS